MTTPKRNARKDLILSPWRTFFATTKTSMGRAWLQSERKATPWIDWLRSDVAAGSFQLHDFAIMPDHVHLLITVSGDSTIERVMPFIKGGFAQNPVRAGWVDSPEKFPYCFTYLAKRKPAGAKQAN